MKIKYIALLAVFLSASYPNSLHSEEISDENVLTSGQRIGGEGEIRKFESGSFDIIPSISGDMGFSDNIYAYSSNEKSDLITKISPKITTKSNWNNHSLEFDAGADIAKYANNSSEDYQDFNLSTKGKFDIQRGIALSGGVKYINTHELRISPDDTNGFEPNKYDTLTLDAKLKHDKGLFDFEIAQKFTSLDFDNNRNISGIIDNSIRDRNVYTTAAKVAYEVIPNYKAFFSGIYDVYSYDTKGTVNRDSTGFTFRVGTDVNISGKTKGKVYIGLVTRKYDQAEFDNINTLEFGTDLIWNVTGKTSLIADISRDIIETVDVRSSGYIYTKFNLKAEHELQDNILLKSNIGYELQEFDDSFSFNREDDIYVFGLGIDYYLQKYLRVGTEYSYRDKESSQSGEDYKINKVSVNAKFNF